VIPIVQPRCRRTARKPVLLQSAPQFRRELQEIARTQRRFHLLHAGFQSEFAHRPFPEPPVLVELARPLLPDCRQLLRTLRRRIVFGLQFRRRLESVLPHAQPRRLPGRPPKLVVGRSALQIA
jgi:hypothetical protein